MGPKAPFQQTLAMWVVITGLVVTGACAITAIVTVQRFPGVAGEAKEILTIVLPVVGTWIGTVLAFYFGRENFEAGARETRRTLGQQALDNRALDAAISVDKIKSIDVADEAAANAKALSDIQTHLNNTGFHRVPVLTTDKKPIYVIHRQPLESFLLGGQAPANPTVQHLFNSANGKVIKEFVVVAESATLAEAKAAMEARKQCQDVFITRTGKHDSPILGWLTNNEIQRAASG